MYKQEVKLEEDEFLQKISKSSGEITTLHKRNNNIPEGKELFNPGYFSKRHIAAWNYLLNNLTDKEITIVSRMALMTRQNSNSLEPLNNQSSVEELSEKFHIHRNSVSKMFNNLLKHGVYAEFKFGSRNGIKHYWVLNPYIDFKGKTISTALVDLFRETTIADLVTKDKQSF